MTVDDDIAALRAAVGARTDMELAEKLGLGRAAISLWRSRGIPAKYRDLIRQPSQPDVANAAAKAMRIAIFGKPQHAYWLKAALAVLPLSGEPREGEDDQARGERLERAVLNAMNLAMSVTLVDLQKPFCDDDADYRRLVSILKEKHAADIARILARAQQQPK